MGAEMNRAQYFQLRDQAYKLVGVVGTEAEGGSESDELSDAYRRGSEMLDAIDALGYRLGFLDPETNEET